MNLTIELNNGNRYEFDRTWGRSYGQMFLSLYKDGVEHQFPYASIVLITSRP